MLLIMHYDDIEEVWMKDAFSKRDMNKIKKFILNMNDKIKYDEEAFICEKKDAEVIYYLLDNGFFKKLIDKRSRNCRFDNPR